MPMMKIGKTVFMGEGSSYIPYSALEYNGSGAISGISGSAIAGGVDSAVVSSIVSSYVESSVSGKADQSALDDCCSAMSSVVSAKADSSAMSSYVPYSSLEYSADSTTITGISGSALGVSGMTLIFDSSMNQTFSGNSSTVGVDVGSFMRAVGDSAEATAANILYIVTGSVIV